MFVLGKREEMQVTAKVYGARELFIFFRTSKTFKLILVFTLVFALLETIFCNYLIAKGIGHGDSTAGLVIIYMAVSMIVINSLVLLVGMVVSAREVKKTIFARVLLPFFAIILAFIVTVIFDSMMPIKIFYTLAKALYLI